MAVFEDDREMSLLVAIVHKMALPVLFFSFGVAYFLNTWGRISLSNLQYPYFALAILLAVTAVVAAQNIYELYVTRDQYDRGTVETVEETWADWHLSVKVFLFSLVYIALIGPLGFILATLVFLIGGMRLAGVDNWLYAIGYGLVTFVLVYLTFITVLDLYVPAGPLGF